MRTKIKNLRDIANKLLIASTLYMFTENVLACDSSVNKIPIQVNEENKSSLKYFLETGNVKIVFDLNSMLNRHSLYNMKCYGNFSITLTGEDVAKNEKFLSYAVLTQNSPSLFYLIIDNDESQYKIYIEYNNKKYEVKLGEDLKLINDDHVVSSDTDTNNCSSFSDPEAYPIILEQASGKIRKFKSEYKKNLRHPDHCSSRY